MARSATLLFAALCSFLLISLGGCGGNAMTNGSTSSGRQLRSITVTPAAADAQNFHNGQVQFSAMGTFNMAPMTVMSMPVRWSIENASAMQPMPMAAMSPAATVDANGLAQCNGFTGIATVQATAPADPNMPLSQMGPMTMTVAGMAQMTCP